MALDGGGRGQVWLEHRVDLRSARTPVQPIDDAFPSHEHERGDDRHLETLRELRLLIDVDAHDAQPRPFPASEVRQQAFHSPCGARTLRAEEDEQGPSVVQWVPPSWAAGGKSGETGMP